ncbi:MAG: DUF350 domain-containing protein [Magnetospiraceae bacterium]
MLSYMGLNANYLLILAIDLVIGAALLVAMRFMMGAVARVNPSEELAQRDNPAFGIVLAGGVFAMGILLTGVLAGDAAASPANEAVLVLAYGVAGLAMVFAAHAVFDKVSMSSFAVRDELRAGNIAVAMTDAGNAIATALIVRAVLDWVQDGGLVTALVGLGSFLVSQALLSLVSFYRIKLHSRTGQAPLMETIRGGNTALALRFSGYRIAAAFAISSALNLAPFDPSAVIWVFGSWILVAVVSLMVLAILSMIAERILLWGIDLQDEVDRQGNVAIGAVQAAVYTALGLAMLAVNS